MPEIVFKDKEYVYEHHLTVLCRPLLVNKVKGIGPADWVFIEPPCVAVSTGVS